jgi:hypothetical protein
MSAMLIPYCSWYVHCEDSEGVDAAGGFEEMVTSPPGESSQQTLRNLSLLAYISPRDSRNQSIKSVVCAQFESYVLRLKVAYFDSADKSRHEAVGGHFVASIERAQAKINHHSFNGVS